MTHRISKPVSALVVLALSAVLIAAAPQTDGRGSAPKASESIAATVASGTVARLLDAFSDSSPAGPARVAAEARDASASPSSGRSQGASSVQRAGGGVAQANPSNAPRTKTIEVHTRYTEPSGNLDGAECSGIATATPTCRGHYVGPVTFTGTMWGDAHYDQAGWVTPDGRITYEGPDYITGGVEGCGTGSYILDMNDGGYIDMTKFDPLTNSAPGYNTWRLRPGSGTGELTNLVSGQGENHWTAYFAGKGGDPEKFGEGDFTGSITCGR